MNPLYINLDISGKVKQSDIIVVSSPDSQLFYYRLYDGKYEIDYSTLSELRLIFEDDETGDLFTVSSSIVEQIKDISYIKITIPLNLTSTDKNYMVRPVVSINNRNIGLIKFKLMSRRNSSVDIETLIRMTESINSIYSVYLSSIKRGEIGSVNGVIPLDENGKMIEIYTPDDILAHIKLKYKGHGLRLNDDYFIEYWDYEDNVWNLLNILNGGKFNIPRKSSEYDYDEGIF